MTITGRIRGQTKRLDVVERRRGELEVGDVVTCYPTFSATKKPQRMTVKVTGKEQRAPRFVVYDLEVLHD